MSKDNYDLFFEILKEISRQSDESYNVLENKVSTLIATNAIVISILIGLGTFLIEGTMVYNKVSFMIFFVTFYFATYSFCTSLAFAFQSFRVKRYKILRPYQIIERYKNYVETEAKETIIDTFADTLKDNLNFAEEKAIHINRSIIFLLMGIIIIPISIIFYIFTSIFLLLP